jgi:hypothetical protein
VVFWKIINYLPYIACPVYFHEQEKERLIVQKGREERKKYQQRKAFKQTSTFERRKRRKLISQRWE